MTTMIKHNNAGPGNFSLCVRNMKKIGAAYGLSLPSCRILIPQSWVKENHATSVHDERVLVISKFWLTKVADNIEKKGGNIEDIAWAHLTQVTEEGKIIKSANDFVKSLRTSDEYWHKAINDGSFETVLTNLLEMFHTTMINQKEKANGI